MKDLTGSERGFVLLTSNLGDPRRKPLTVAQFRELIHRVGNLEHRNPDRDLTPADMISIGYGVDFAEHIVELLRHEQQLDWYLNRAAKAGCVCITRASDSYPALVRRRLGEDSPGVLWAKGDLSLLQDAAISLVGSRELGQQNRLFAQEVGRQAASQGLTLVSGNARGADKTAQNACLKAGGRVISIVADALAEHEAGERILYLSENSYDEGFSAQRAISRNRVIHTLGWMVFVAQATLEKGGTWDGTVKNLRHGWSSVACFRDGSEAFRELEQMGAFGVDFADLEDLGALAIPEKNLFDR